MTCWYTRKELALRTAVLYSGLVLATAFSGLIAAGVLGHLDGARGLAGWRWLFIIESSASFLVALVAMVIMPDYPESKTGSASWFMTAEERQLAQDRIARDRVSNGETKRTLWYSVKLAANDVRTWIFVSSLPVLAQVDRKMASNPFLFKFVTGKGYYAVQQSHDLWLQQLLPHDCGRVRLG